MGQVLSVVIPAHNERDYLRDSVLELAEGLRPWGRSFELVVVENGSVDGTSPDSAYKRLVMFTPAPVITMFTLGTG